MIATKLPEITERAWQKTIIDAFRVFGWGPVFHDSVAWRSDPGYPDLTAIHTGQRRVIWVELKRQSGKLSAAQARWGDDLRSAGLEWYCLRPSDWPTFERILRGERLC